MATNTLKDIIDTAIRNETDAYEFYLHAVDVVKDPAAKVLLKEFADIEWKHKIRLENFNLDEIADEHHTVHHPQHDFNLSQYLMDKEITQDSTVQDVMIHAMKREESAYNFYNDMSKVVTSIDVKNLFEALAAEELSHKVRIETEYDDVIYKEF
ncbi:MAG: ferritin family protein [Candidatus Scalindua sp.]|nr:ferritin family protein [Candidatus Scalindua sp.]